MAQSRHSEHNASFPGQMAPTGSFSAKTLPVGPENDFINRPFPLIRKDDLFLPESGHVFEGLSLRFRNKLPDEYGSENADESVQAVGEGVTEVLH